MPKTKMERDNKDGVDNLISQLNVSMKLESNDGDNCKYVTNEKNPKQLNVIQSPAVRKDTKDSGYGDAISEREGEQDFMPDWCHECKNAEEESEEEGTNRTLSIQNYSSKNCGVYDDDVDGVDHNNDDHDRFDLRNCNSSKEKIPKRHRRITPVPLSTPIKLCLGSSPDYLFVEEEDAEDINNFNSEDDYLDQGFIGQASDSPNWNRKLYQRKRNQGCSNDEQKNDCLDVEPAKVFLRSKSENDTELLASSTQTKSRKCKFENRCDPESSPAASLPEWMKNAKQEHIDGCSCYWDPVSEPSQICGNSFAESSSQSGQLESGAVKSEGSIKIYVPNQKEQVRKGPRSRKLTPVQTASPSLDKIWDLQDQAMALSLAEEMQDDDN